MDRSIEIPAEEWANVSSIVGFAEPDERSVLAMVLLSSDGSRRSRWAMDSYRMAGVSGGSDDGTYRVLVSPRIIQAAVTASGVWGAARLSTSDRDGRGGGPSVIPPDD